MVAIRVVTLVQIDIESTLTVSPVEYNNKLTLSSDSGPQGLVSRVARTTYKVTGIAQSQTTKESQVDRTVYENEATTVNTNRIANMTSRQCLTDRHTDFTSRVIFDFMYKFRHAFLNIMKVVPEKKKRRWNILSQSNISL